MPICTACGTDKPLTEFSRHRRMASGYRNQCKACRQATTRKRYAADPVKQAQQQHKNAAWRAKAENKEWLRRWAQDPNNKARARELAKKPERKAAKQAYAQQPERVAKQRASVVAWEAAHPDRKIAIHAVNHALRDGKLSRLPCWVCGAKAEAHHPCYALPLDVVWLCRDHHKQLHREATQ